MEQRIQSQSQYLTSLQKENPDEFQKYLKAHQLTYDFLPDSDIYLLQHKKMFRFNTDTALLGNFIRVYEHESVLDIGTNNGALLLYASRFSNHLYGCEIQEEAARLALLNMEMHNKKADIMIGDIADYPDTSFHVIVCNPPYFPLQEQVIKPTPRQIARHEITLNLKDLMHQIDRLLIDNGRCYLVHRSDRLMEIIHALHEIHIEIKRLQIIYDDAKDSARSVLIEGVRYGKPGCDILKPIIIKR